MNGRDDPEARRQRLQELRERFKQRSAEGGAAAEGEGREGGGLRARMQRGRAGAGGKRALRQGGGGGFGGGGGRGLGGGGGGGGQRMGERILGFLTNVSADDEVIPGTSVARGKLETFLGFLNRSGSSSKGGKFKERLTEMIAPIEVDGQLQFDAEKVNRLVKLLEGGAGKKREGFGRAGMPRQRRGKREDSGLAASMKQIEQTLQHLDQIAEKWSQEMQKTQQVIAGLQEATMGQAASGDRTGGKSTAKQEK